MSSSYDPNIDKSSSPLAQPSEPLASPQDEPASVPTDVAPAAALDFDVNSTSTIVISTGRVREDPCCHCLPAYFTRARGRGGAGDFEPCTDSSCKTCPPTLGARRLIDSLPKEPRTEISARTKLNATLTISFLLYLVWGGRCVRCEQHDRACRRLPDEHADQVRALAKGVGELSLEPQSVSLLPLHPLRLITILLKPMF